MTMKKIFKKTFGLIPIMLLMFLLSPLHIFAAEDARTYEFELSVNGEHEVYAEPGDVLNVTMTLHRTDLSKESKIYAIQDEIRYDPKFFEILEDGTFTQDGIEITDIGLIDGDRAFYINYLSLNGGTTWKADTITASFQVKVLADKGSSYLKNENYKVSKKDGSSSYETSAKDLLVIVSSECLVKFDSMGGSAVEEQNVLFGNHLLKPEDPIKDGYTFTGWYRDIHLNEEWNFDEDVVTGNMTLFAGWQSGTIISENETSQGFPWWIFVVILYTLIAVFLILLYKKRKKEKKS